MSALVATPVAVSQRSRHCTSHSGPPLRVGTRLPLLRADISHADSMSRKNSAGTRAWRRCHVLAERTKGPEAGRLKDAPNLELTDAIESLLSGVHRPKHKEHHDLF